MDDIPNKRHFRPDEVAEIFRFSVRTVRRWVAEGRMEGKQTHGKGIRISKYSIHKLSQASDKERESQ